MRRIFPLLLCGAGLAFGACAETPAVKLDVATLARLQIRTAQLQAAHGDDTIPGFATVMDTSTFLQLLSDYGAAKAALAASQAEANRTAILAKDATVSAKVAEAAKAQAVADQTKVTLLRQRLGFEWGPYFAGLSDASLTQLAHDIAAGQAAVIRVDTPSGKGQRGATSVAIDLAAFGSVQARVVGVARTADQKLQSPGVVAIVTGSQAAYLGNGLTLTATLYGGGATAGILVPNGALLRKSGHVYAYVRTAPQTFVRREVVPLRVVADGLVTNQGFRIGDTVAIRGASALLAAESAADAKSGD